MDVYRLGEPPKQNENITHKIQISPPPVLQRKDLLYHGKWVAEV